MLNCGTPPAPDPQTVALEVRAKVSAAIDKVVAEVTAADIETPLAFNLTVDNGVASDTIQVPAGSDRTITVKAFDAGGVETHRGSVVVDIAEGDNPAVTVTIEPLTGDQPIVVVIGSFTVTVMPATASLKVGETLQLTAEVRDVNDDPINVDVVWATLNLGGMLRRMLSGILCPSSRGALLGDLRLSVEVRIKNSRGHRV